MDLINFSMEPELWNIQERDKLRFVREEKEAGYQRPFCVYSREMSIFLSCSQNWTFIQQFILLKIIVYIGLW